MTSLSPRAQSLVQAGGFVGAAMASRRCSAMVSSTERLESSFSSARMARYFGSVVGGAARACSNNSW